MLAGMESQRLSTQSITVPKLAYSLAEAELATGLSRRTLDRMIAAGKLQTVKRGGRRLVPADVLERLCRPDDDSQPKRAEC